MTGSNPVGQGSNPWGRALRRLACRQTDGPVAQRRGQLRHEEMIGGSSPPRTTRLGRQSADHPGLEPGMLWVRLPPGPLQLVTSSWSSQECSPACHAGDRGFKSHRGRLDDAVRKPAKRRSSNLRDCLWVRLPPVLLEQHASVGHWQAPLAVNQSSEWTLAVQLRPGALRTDNHGAVR